MQAYCIHAHTVTELDMAREWKSHDSYMTHKVAKLLVRMLRGERETQRQRQREKEKKLEVLGKCGKASLRLCGFSPLFDWQCSGCDENRRSKHSHKSHNWTKSNSAFIQFIDRHIHTVSETYVETEFSCHLRKILLVSFVLWLHNSRI